MDGSQKIRGMKIKLDAPEMVMFGEEALEPLKCLRWFLAYKALYYGSPIKFPKTLRCLEWEGYSSSLLPLNGSADWELAGLYVRESKIEDFHDTLENLGNLRFLYLSKSASLQKIPDLSSLPILEILDAEECSELEEVDQSVGELTKLVCLNFLNCGKLHTFPHVLKSEYLEELTLKGCSKLSRFPDIGVRMDKLEQLSLHKTRIHRLPSSIENISGLKELYLCDCKRLDVIPNSIYGLKSLQRVSLHGCSALVSFPKPESYQSAFPDLVHIDLRGCSLSKITFMRRLHCTLTLQSLDISGNKLVEIPEFIGKFSALKELSMKKCKELRYIRGLPPKLRILNAEGCKLLESCVQLSRFLNPDSVNSLSLNFSGCYKLS